MKNLIFAVAFLSSVAAHASYIFGASSGGGGGGTVTAVTGTAPIVSSGGTTPVISCVAATGSVAGCLSAADWTTFNSKLTATLTSGHLFVGNGSNVATSVAMSSDGTISNTGALTVTKAGGGTGTFGYGALANSGYQRVASATNGGSTTIGSNVTTLILKSAGLINVYTVTLPASPADGQIISITSNNGFNALTISPNAGQTTSISSVAWTSASEISLIYSATDTNWYPYDPNSYVSNSLLAGKIFVGNGSDIATATTLTGNISLFSGGSTTVNTVGGETASHIASTVSAVDAANPNGTSGDLVVIGGTSGTGDTFITVNNIIGPSGLGNYTTMSPSDGTWAGFDGNIAVSIADHYSLVDRFAAVAIGWSDRSMVDFDSNEVANWATDFEWDVSHLGGDLGNGNPSVAPDVGAGTGGTATASVNSLDLAWQVTVVTGTLPTGSNAIIATYTLAQNFQDGNPPTAITLSPGNAAAVALAGTSAVYVDMAGAGVGSFNIVSGTVGLAAGTTYIWDGVIIH